MYRVGAVPHARGGCNTNLLAWPGGAGGGSIKDEAATRHVRKGGGKQ